MRFRTKTRILTAFGALLLGTALCHAERKYILGVRNDFMGGMGNQSGSSQLNLSQLGQGTEPYFSILPSLQLKSSGKHSEFDLAYTFIWDRFQSDPTPVSVDSHALRANLRSDLGKRARLTLSETLSNAPDFTAINVLKGFILTSEGFQYVFEPSLSRRSGLNNSLNAGIEVDLTQHTFLTFSAASSLRHYEREASSQSAYLQDQTRVEGGFSLSHRISERRNWGLGYSIYRNDYQSFGSSRSHAFTWNYSQEMSPSLQLNLELGPSWAEKNSLQDSYLGYNASLRISKLVRTSQLSLSYTRRTGDSTGLGYSTDSHQGGIGFSVPFGRFTSLNLDLAAFQQKQRSNSAFDYTGIRSSVALSRTFARYWVLSFGGNYQGYQGQSGISNQLTYKRVYISLGFNIPELWKGSR